MKKTLFFVLAFILVACSPQVTITSEVTVTSPTPTETPIPTPTLNPEFIVLQNLIADSGERFTLLPDGTLEEVTVDGGRQTVPNLHVDQNGIINIMFNNEHIIIEQSQISFDDENGLTIEGYKLENGAWVEAVSEAEQQMYADFDNYNQDLAQDIENGKYTVETDPEGNITLRNAEGEIVYQNGSFEPLFLGQQIVENNMCRKLPWTASEIGYVDYQYVKYEYVQEYAQSLRDYYNLLLKSKAIQSTGKLGRQYYLGDGCWGSVFHYLENQDKVWFFWQDTDENNNKLHRELVFLKSDQD